MTAALITGGAKRVGADLARQMARWGYDIALHYNASPADAERVAGDIRAAGRRVHLIQADLADADQTARLVPAAAKALPELSCVINNASLFDYDRAKSLSVDTWDRQFDVNLRAPALICRDFAAHSASGGRPGVIINMLDQKIFNPSPEFFSYTVSKAALATLTQLLAVEFAPAIRVNGIAPGLTLPSGKQTRAQFDACHDKTLLGKGARIESIAAAVKYLLEADVVTGQILYVDGGEHLQPQRDYKGMV